MTPLMLALGETWINLNAIEQVRFKEDRVMIWFTGNDPEDHSEFGGKTPETLRAALEQYRVKVASDD